MKDWFIDKAISCRADALIIDLEDSVLPEDKPAARARVHEVSKRLRRPSVDVIARINRPFSQALRDIEASIGRDVSALMIAKAESAAHLAYLSEFIGESETHCAVPVGSTGLVALLETAAAIQKMEEICCSPRVVAVGCGDEDPAADLGCSPTSRTIASTNIKW